MPGCAVTFLPFCCSKVKASSTAKGTILEVLAALLLHFPGELVDPHDKKCLGG